MGCNTGGFEFEQQVIDTLIAAGVCGTITEGAGASAADADADMMVNGVRHLIEVKQDAKAQMGGTSLKFNGSFEVVGKGVSEETVGAICTEMNKKRGEIKNLLDFIGADSFPASCEKKVWDEAKEKGLLVPVNTIVKRDAQFICDHYRKKGIHYIQIGGAGLFHMGENPANLPVPKLEGAINLEVRAGRSGSRKGKDGVERVSGGLRVQGRLQFDGKSDFTLENVESIKKMIKSLNISE
jgi:hypothetical protein